MQFAVNEAEYRAMVDMMQRAIYAQSLKKTFTTSPRRLKSKMITYQHLTIAGLGATKRSKSINI